MHLTQMNIDHVNPYIQWNNICRSIFILQNLSKKDRTQNNINLSWYKRKAKLYELGIRLEATEMVIKKLEQKNSGTRA